MENKRKKINYFNLTFLLSLFLLFFSCQRERKPSEPIVSTNIENTTLKTENIEVLNVSKPTVNVYIDNSGSMKGFVDGVSEFRDMIHQYIMNDIKGSGVALKVNTYFINNTITDCCIPSSLDNPKNLNKKNTDIANLVKQILTRTGEDTISIFVSDCVFSPSNLKPNQYLGQQQILIQNEFTAYKNRIKNVAIIVYQIDAQFKNNGKIPYYIWLIGQTGQLSALQRKVPIPCFNNMKAINSYSTLAGITEVNYAIKRNSGNFDLDKNEPKSILENWKKESKGHIKDIARVAIDVDFSQLLIDDVYLRNANNYKYNPEFKLSVSKSTDNKHGYTHTINITTDKIRKGILSIKLMKNKPKWIEACNDSVGETNISGKTYGLKYQLQGINNAFSDKDTNYYTEITINIK